MRYWEDFAVGETARFGAYTVTEAEIIEFGQQYDPLPFHVDPVAAADGPYGGLTAPGLLTCAIFMRLLVDHVLADAASMGSPGVDSLRWTQPVRPGDVLGVRQEVVSKRVLTSRPELGLVKSRFQVCNQRDEVVADIHSNALFARRDAEATA